MPPNSYPYQALVTTVLPQGLSGNVLRCGAFITPQLVSSSTPGASSALTAFPDFVNWPQTLIDLGELIYDVQFTLYPEITYPANPTPTAVYTVGARVPLTSATLDPTAWAALFDPALTRVDSKEVEDFSGSNVNITSYSVLQARTSVLNAYTAWAGAYSAPPTVTFTDSTAAGSDTASSIVAAIAESFNGSGSVLQDLINFHQSTSSPSSVATQPVLDFHEAISALSSYPELLHLFGLAFTFDVTLDDTLLSLLTNGVATAVNVGEEYTTQGFFTVSLVTRADFSLPTYTVPLQTAINKFGMPMPFGANQDGSGLLVLANGVQLTNEGIAPGGWGGMVVHDLDVDHATHSIMVTNTAIQTAVSNSGGNVTLTVPFPAVRSTGITFSWDNWAGLTTILGPMDNPVSPVGDVGFAMDLPILLQRQANLQYDIVTAINALSPNNVGQLNDTLMAIPVLYAEDVTRGYRVDVFDTTLNGPWQSLHWRNGRYVIGSGSSQLLYPPMTGRSEVPPTLLTEGFLSPGASSPVSSSLGPLPLSVSENFARWDGWSLAVPRPGGQINDDGSVSEATVNAVPTNTIDGYQNAQIAALFSSPSAGATANDPFTGAATGVTGLPVLRFGHQYYFRMRAVDLTGWSLPLNGAGGELSSTVTMLQHQRWEPVSPPMLFPPTDTFSAGEGLYNLVLRGDGSTTPAPSGGRWLFAPIVHQALAEECGVFDNGNSLPEPAQFSTIAAYDNTSPTTTSAFLPMADPSNGLYLPLTDGQPAWFDTNWMTDPNAAGVCVSCLYRGLDVFQAYQQNEEFSNNLSTAFVWPGNTSLNGCWPWNVDRGGWPQFGGYFIEAVLGPPVSDYNTLDKALPTVTLVDSTSSTTQILQLTIDPGSVWNLSVSSSLTNTADNSAGAIPAYPGLVTQLPVLQTGIGFGGHGIVIKSAGYTPEEIDELIYPGQTSQVTPGVTLQLVGAVLLPRVQPAFSTPQFVRQPGSITVEITDENYVCDTPVSATVTVNAAWTDLVDDVSKPLPSGGFNSVPTAQQAFVATCNSLYPAPVAENSLAPVPPVVGQPYGTSSAFAVIDFDALSTPGLSATHRIGDTRHHLVTYSATAASRFTAFFNATVNHLFDPTNPTETYVIDARGFSPNGVQVFNLTINQPAIPIAIGTGVTVDYLAGTVALTSAGAQSFGPGSVLSVNYNPTDYVPGPSEPAVTPAATQTFHIMSSAEPPPLKIVRVLPAWSIDASQPGSFTRSGNYLRVYFERPFNVTGNDELVGVVTMSPGGTGPIGTAQGDPNFNTTPENVDVVSLVAYDSITQTALARPGGTQLSANMTQLTFTPDATIPADSTARTWMTVTGTSSPAGTVAIPISPTDDANVNNNYTIWPYQANPYQPTQDAADGLWYVDVKLEGVNVTNGTEAPPPGYFLRLALVRFQPYSNLQLDAESATMLTPPSWVSRATTCTVVQPVPDRQVTVSQTASHTYMVQVTGVGYSGFRPIPHPLEEEKSTSGRGSTVSDDQNPYAKHYDGSGSPQTSTMVVEVQYRESGPFQGDFGWVTDESFTVRLTPSFVSNSSTVIWSSSAVQTPDKASLELRFRISELDLYPFDDEASPPVITAANRRTFVAHLPL